MKQRLTEIAILAALLTVLVSCGPTTTPAPKPTASATPPTPAQPRTHTQVTNGTVASVEGSTASIATAQGQVTVTVGSNTSIQKVVTGALSDLQQGESLTVIGSRDANSNIAATSITIRPQAQGAPTPPPGA